MPGDLTISTAADTRSTVLAALEQGGDLELDLASTEELDTAGLQVLLLAHREATARGTRLSLVDVPAGIRSVLAVVGFDEALTRVHLGVATTDIEGGRSDR